MTRTITLRGICDEVLERLRRRAEAERRSLNGELLTILADAARDEPVAPRDAVSDPLHAVDREALARVCARHHIEWLAVFGSHARGEARAHSDVDVVVDFAPGKTPGFGFERVAEALRGVFGGRRVDLVTRRALSPRVRAAILPSAVLLYGAD
jgi:predicted nucleotidyltransferase